MPQAWFTSFDAIPGSVWSPLLPLTSETVAGHDAVARVERQQHYFRPGDVREALVWETPRGDRLQGSPAARHGIPEEGGEVTRSPAELARQISQLLALPGTAADYHFAMLRAWDALWKARSRELRAFDWIERLCLADISMFESLDGLAWTQADEAPEARRLDTIPAAPAFNRLAAMYVREGFLADAAELEARHEAMADLSGRPEKLADRQRAMRGGDVG